MADGVGKDSAVDCVGIDSLAMAHGSGKGFMADIAFVGSVKVDKHHQSDSAHSHGTRHFARTASRKCRKSQGKEKQRAQSVVAHQRRAQLCHRGKHGRIIQGIIGNRGFNLAAVGILHAAYLHHLHLQVLYVLVRMVALAHKFAESGWRDNCQCGHSPAEAEGNDQRLAVAPPGIAAGLDKLCQSQDSK